MNDTVIANVRALEPGKGSDRGLGANSAGQDRRSSARPRNKGTAPQLPEQIDGGGRLLTPGLIDIHTHGIEQFAYEAGPEQFVAASRQLARYGTTCVLPTPLSGPFRQRLGDLERLAAVLSTVEDVCTPGLHLEGPFLAVCPASGAKDPCPAILGFFE